jgi:hypothetical protein
MTSDLRRAWASVLRALEAVEVVVFEFPQLDGPDASAKHQRNIYKIVDAPDDTRHDWLDRYEREACVALDVECGIEMGDGMRASVGVILRMRRGELSPETAHTMIAQERETARPAWARYFQSYRQGRAGGAGG